MALLNGDEAREQLLVFVRGPSSKSPAICRIRILSSGPEGWTRLTNDRSPAWTHGTTRHDPHISWSRQPFCGAQASTRLRHRVEQRQRFGSTGWPVVVAVDTASDTRGMSSRDALINPTARLALGCCKYMAILHSSPVDLGGEKKKLSLALVWTQARP